MTPFIRLLLLISMLAMLISVHANEENLVRHFANSQPHRRVSRYTPWGDVGAMISPFNSYESNHRAHPCNI
jgi:hypothetical protein